MASLTLVGGMAALATPASASGITVDVSNASATCNTITGSLKFSTPLTLTGPTTGNEDITVKATVAGCTSSAVNSGNSVFSGAVTGTLVSTGGTGCLGLSGAGTASGTLLTAWKPPKGYVFQPTQTIGTKTAVFTHSVISGDVGTTYSVTGQSPFAGSYGQFLLGTAYSAPQIHTQAGDGFTGGDSGHSSWQNVVGNSDVVNLLAACGGSGVKSLIVGIGGAFVG